MKKTLKLIAVFILSALIVMAGYAIFIRLPHDDAWQEMSKGPAIADMTGGSRDMMITADDTSQKGDADAAIAAGSSTEDASQSSNDAVSQSTDDDISPQGDTDADAAIAADGSTDDASQSSDDDASQSSDDDASQTTAYNTSQQSDTGADAATAPIGPEDDTDADMGIQTTDSTGQDSERLGVLIVYMDPGIEHDRAIEVLDAAKSLGIRWIRIGFIWALANPQPDTYDFTEFDFIIGEAAKRGFHILPTITWTPDWASSYAQATNPEDNLYVFYPPTTEAIVDEIDGMDYLEIFAQAASERYKDEINHWELWNEPDMKYFLRDTDDDGSTVMEYCTMLEHFNKGIKKGNEDAKVVLGGLALDTRFGAEPGFVEGIIADCRDSYDIHNIHLNFQYPQDAVKILEEHSAAAGKPIFVTEISYSPEQKYQNLAGYMDGEESFSLYVKDISDALLETQAKAVFWAALHDYKPEEDNGPYQYSGLLTYGLEEKDAAEQIRR